jgi:hypothetical protein
LQEHDRRVDAAENSNGTGPPDDLTRRADELLHRAGALRRQCEQLGERLEAIARAMPEGAALRPPEQSEGIRLVATNLALNGATREEVDARLKEAFGTSSNDALLDEVFAAIERSSK